MRNYTQELYKDSSKLEKMINKLGFHFSSDDLNGDEKLKNYGNYILIKVEPNINVKPENINMVTRLLNKLDKNNTDDNPVLSLVVSDFMVVLIGDSPTIKFEDINLKYKRFMSKEFGNKWIKGFANWEKLSKDIESDTIRNV